MGGVNNVIQSELFELHSISRRSIGKGYKMHMAQVLELN